MANYLKVKAGPVADDGIETLINISKIAGVKSVVNALNVTTLEITMDTSVTSKYVIAVPGVSSAGGPFTATQREAQLVEILNSALTANPGGVVSTLGAVPALLQEPAAQSGAQGRLAITQAATFAQYTTCIYTP
tara:strand:+ start:39 stop:440 length:402 start_codon:yes stop_codon:yes gene_type:complete